MSYRKIDPIVENWARAHEILILKEDGEPNRRYFYVSSQAGETFQLVVEPEKDGTVRMDAHLIESPGDEEAHFVWEVPISKTQHMLDLGLGSAQAWFRRTAR